jgi:hypothetical protein
MSYVVKADGSRAIEETCLECGEVVLWEDTRVVRTRRKAGSTLNVIEVIRSIFDGLSSR